MGSFDYYDRQGRVIPRYAFAKLFQDAGYKRVAATDGPGWRVSTVWLGLNHEWDENRPPLIFETMIFGGEHDESQWRWHTEDGARTGHDWIVTCLEIGANPFTTPDDPAEWPFTRPLREW